MSKHEQGICPKCGSDGLTYGDTKKQDIAIGYNFICESCKFEGIEWYNLHFTEHTDPGCVVVPKEVEKPCKDCNDIGWTGKVHNTNDNTIEIHRCLWCRKYATDREAARELLNAARQNVAKVLIFVSGGLVQCVTSTDPNISVTLADKDNIETEEDEAAYNLLVSLSESDGYTEVIY